MRVNVKAKSSSSCFQRLSVSFCLVEIPIYRSLGAFTVVRGSRGREFRNRGVISFTFPRGYLVFPLFCEEWMVIYAFLGLNCLGERFD